MKRIIALLAVLAVSLVFLAGCGGNDTPEETEQGYYWERIGTSDLSGVGSEENYTDLLKDRGRMFCVAADKEGNPVLSIQRFLEGAEGEAAATQPSGDYYSWLCAQDSGTIFVDGENRGDLKVRTYFDNMEGKEEADVFSGFLSRVRKGDDRLDDGSVKVTEILTKFIDGKQVRYVRMTYSATPKNEDGEADGATSYRQVMLAYYPVKMPNSTSGFVVVEVDEERPDTRMFVDDTIIDRATEQLLYTEGVE